MSVLFKIVNILPLPYICFYPVKHIGMWCMKCAVQIKLPCLGERVQWVDVRCGLSFDRHRCYNFKDHKYSSNGGRLDLHANMLLLLLLCFLSSAVCWLGESKLFSSLSSLVICCVISDSSSLGSGLGVSGSGVWKLQSAEAEWVTVARTRKTTGIYFHSLLYPLDPFALVPHT